jgi:hypothetical protein
MHPFLLKDLAFELPAKKAPDLLKLALGLAFVIFESFGIIVGFVELGFE